MLQHDLKEGEVMGRCEVCGKEFDANFEMLSSGWGHPIDCWDHLAEIFTPRCAICGCPVPGQGLDDAGSVYCCAYCGYRIRNQDQA